MGVVFCSYPSLEGGGPSSGQECCLFKWYWHNFFSFSQYVHELRLQKEREGDKGSKRYRYFTENAAFCINLTLPNISLWSLPPFFFFWGGGERKIIYLTSPALCEGDELLTLRQKNVAFSVCFTLCNIALLFHHFNSVFCFVLFAFV